MPIDFKTNKKMPKWLYNFLYSIGVIRLYKAAKTPILLIGTGVASYINLIKICEFTNIWIGILYCIALIGFSVYIFIKIYHKPTEKRAKSLRLLLFLIMVPSAFYYPNFVEKDGGIIYRKGIAHNNPFSVDVRYPSAKIKENKIFSQGDIEMMIDTIPEKTRKQLRAIHLVEIKIVVNFRYDIRGNSVSKENIEKLKEKIKSMLNNQLSTEYVQAMLIDIFSGSRPKEFSKIHYHDDYNSKFLSHIHKSNYGVSIQEADIFFEFIYP